LAEGAHEDSPNVINMVNPVLPTIIQIVTIHASHLAAVNVEPLAAPIVDAATKNAMSIGV
jgi:hypothetical protein